jgi:adenylate cyclase
VIVSAIQEQGGDVLKLIGDAALAIFAAEDRTHAVNAALSAAIAAREGILALNKCRQLDGKPVTDMNLGLHAGEVFYGNIGSRERLDFTVMGPAVNEVVRIAAMCRSVVFCGTIRAARCFSGTGAIYARSYCLRLAA